MYETVDALFTGICDAIRDKDGTTEFINHQDIPERIAGISSGSGKEKYYIYKSGEEMNEHSMSIHQGGASSKKTEGWIYINYYYAQVLASDLIQVNGHRKIGLTFLADATKFNHEIRHTIFSIRDTANIDIAGNDHAPAESGTVHLEQDILRYPDTNSLMSGTIYFDIPEDLQEFYIVFSTVNVDLYIEEIWLE